MSLYSWILLWWLMDDDDVHLWRFSDVDMWAWLVQVFDPTVMNKEATFYDNGNNFNNLLGQVRLRQQRQLPAGLYSLLIRLCFEKLMVE